MKIMMAPRIITLVRMRQNTCMPSLSRLKMTVNSDATNKAMVANMIRMERLKRLMR